MCKYLSFGFTHIILFSVLLFLLYLFKSVLGFFFLLFQVMSSMLYLSNFKH
jgi:hypothetical protein